MKHLTRILQALISVIFLFVVFSNASADRVNDIAATKHNLSATSGNSTRADVQNEICVFCHTPHGATDTGLPLWNRSFSAATYTTYDSSSLDADPTYNNGPNGKTKLCLSCHDGTIALGDLNVANGGTLAGDITMSGGVTTMPDGSGASTGFTKNLGIDLSNDHPVSFRYNDALATKDTELRAPSGVSHLGVRQSGAKPQYPLEPGNEMHCTTCHDPHVSGADLPGVTTLRPGETDNIKFLRGKRFQMATPSGTNYKEATDIVCLSCHDKLGEAWNNSVHANSTDANEVYKTAASDQRDFPRNIQVWQAGCLNCHDTHAVSGTRRLLREGTDSISSPKQGGNPAIEETCYQCHTNGTDSILTSVTDVPDIETEFARSYTMPITDTPTGNAKPGNELAHDIGDPAESEYPFSYGAGANFLETPEQLGKGINGSNLGNRHAECTDCHNPHRMIKNEKYTGFGGSTKATHDHSTSAGLNHNDAPGALKGTFGVDIVSWGTVPTAWNAATNGAGEENTTISFGTLPTFFDIKCGVSATDCGGNDQVTKEYQVCLKCHSNYAYDDNGNPEGATGGTGRPDAIYSEPENPFTQYTNQAMEFQAPTAHQGETNSMVDSGAHSRYEGTSHYNHRSWHPVMLKTGRTRGSGPGGGQWQAPWSSNLGNQTMMCSDCHNNGTNGKAETAGAVGGPHGSNNPRLLRNSAWNDNSTLGDAICADCHAGLNNGMSNSGSGFDHAEHQDRANFRCSYCHIAIPHGWKNKSFIANLQDVGPEVTCDSQTYSPSCTIGQPIPKGTRYNPSSRRTRYYNPPYYMGAVLDVRTFRQAGSWNEASCGDVGQGGETWMDNTCG